MNNSSVYTCPNCSCSSVDNRVKEVSYGSDYVQCSQCGLIWHKYNTVSFDDVITIGER
jgi:uncharacterized Zn finger protein